MNGIGSSPYALKIIWGIPWGHQRQHLANVGDLFTEHLRKAFGLDRAAVLLLLFDPVLIDAKTIYPDVCKLQ